MERLKKYSIFTIDHLEEIVVVVCMLGIVILTFTAVIARYVLKIPIAGADEVATFMFLWAALFGASAAFKYNQHGSVPLLADFLPSGCRRIADLLVLLVTAAFFAFLAYYCWIFLIQSVRVGQTSSATGIPVWTINAGIFASLSMCGVRCLIAVVRDIAGLPRYKNVPSSDMLLSESELEQQYK
ncbi:MULTISPECIES: TRAP transporter small permease [unclassified Marinobacter]|uniref:TRAP transporter small permease n=1 Tax=unclassified Marinobacter TaxID=83889 RepID=UPI001651ABAF|nr:MULTISPECIES: TRAP transporter small permease [unclassified Marinobacter]MDO6441144.1 TRAP transporter small permease [Marinobacter sp. 2_MG-2023]